MTESKKPSLESSILLPCVLMLATSASILATDLHIPSLPDLVSYFETTPETVQLTMSFNLAAYAVAHLIYGPLADRFGRRPVLLFGMLGFAMASLGCAFAWSIQALVAGRILQGIMAAAQSVTVVTIIRDKYPGSAGVRILGVYGMVLAVTPAIGPVIGGYIHVWVGWQANFVLLSCFICIALLLAWRIVPETASELSTSLRFRTILGGYLVLMCHRQFRAYAMCSGFICAGLFGFVTAGPFALMDVLDVKTEHYGWYQAIVVFAFFLGSLFATRYVRSIGVEKLLQLGLVTSACGGALLVALTTMDLVSPLSIVLCVSVFYFGMALNFATVPIRALDSAPTGRAAAAAVLGLTQFGGGAIGALSVSLLHEHSIWPLAMTLCGAAMFAGICYVIATPWRSVAAIH